MIVNHIQGFGVFSKDEIISHGSKGLIKEDFKYLGPLLVDASGFSYYLDLFTGEALKFDPEIHFIKFHKNNY